VETITPVTLRERERGLWSADFGKAAFGTLRLECELASTATVVVRLGEKLDLAERVDLAPGGCIRFLEVKLELSPGRQSVTVEIPPDQRNTGPRAIPMPAELFQVLPFRYAEVRAPEGALVSLAVEQLAVFYPFDLDAASFTCSDPRLDAVWELCKYSIKATSFCGVYVDGDRERIPYEGDAYINQLSHYGVDAEYEMARHSLEYLLFNPTWPTEWSLHCVPMAWADYEYTGRADLLEAYYPLLRRKALLELEREDGLISTETGLVTPELLEALHLKEPLADLVDWPPGSFTAGGTGERDNHEMRPINTVVNAFYYWNLCLLERIAEVLGKLLDAEDYRTRAERVRASMHRELFNAGRGIFVDGIGSSHASQHSNLFPAAFGLVPEGAEASVLDFIRARGMACSVYGAQYLLEALYRLGAPDHALALMTAEHDRGWLNMLKAGSTVTLEAWDLRYKLNLDWNHAWGAAPGNIIPRFVAGVRPAAPGFGTVLVDPQPGGLRAFTAKIPTPHGPVSVRLEGGTLTIDSPVPVRFRGRELPAGRQVVEF
jgi:hypothetical protein